METIVETVKSMNEMLKGQVFSAEQFETLVKTMQDQFKTKFRILDFEYHNEQRLTWAHARKLKCIEDQNFEAAATCRDLEVACQKHIDLRENYNLNESAFLHEDNYLLYLYFGNQVHDKEARLYINRYC